MLEQKFRSFQERGHHQLQRALDYNFHNSNLLNQALTRRSAINSGIVDKRNGHNESLEFLGDRVLNLVMADIVRAQHPDWDEGHLTIEHSKLIQNFTLAGIAKKMNLCDYLIMDSGERINNSGQQNQKILADSLEAIIGAIYLDSNRKLQAIGRFVFRHWYSLQQVLFESVSRLPKLEEGQDQNPQINEQIIELIKLGADIRKENENGQIIFHLMEFQCGLIKDILEAEKNWAKIDLRGVPKDTFRGYEYATDDVYYQALHFKDMNFREANLTGVDLSSRTMSNVNFAEAILCGTDFAFVKFHNVSFKGANIKGANFKHCVMDKATRASYLQAVKENNIEPFEIAIDYSEFWQAVNNNDVNTVRECLERGYKIGDSHKTAAYTKDNNGLTALHIAAGLGYGQMTELLLNHGADTQATVKQHSRVDPREFLSEGHLINFKQQTAKVGSVSVINATPLDLARGNGHKNTEDLIFHHMGLRNVSIPSEQRVSSSPSSTKLGTGNDHRQEVLSRHGNADERGRNETTQQGFCLLM